MIEPPLFPEEYHAYKTLVICSNTFEDVQIPIAINQQPLLLIGRGDEIPLVWLAAPSHPSSTNWVFVVKASKAVYPGINVQSGKRGLTFQVGGIDVLNLKSYNETNAEVSELNLRPVGLDVVGTSNLLKVGGGNFTRNHIKGARVGVNITVPGDARLIML